MKTMIMRCTALVGALSVLVPAAAQAHDGHGPHHGWLAGALQPLLSLDHFLAALFVMAVLSIGLGLGLRRAEAGKRQRWS